MKRTLLSICIALALLPAAYFSIRKNTNLSSGTVVQKQPNTYESLNAREVKNLLDRAETEVVKLKSVYEEIKKYPKLEQKLEFRSTSEIEALVKLILDIETLRNSGETRGDLRTLDEISNDLEGMKYAREKLETLLRMK